LSMISQIEIENLYPGHGRFIHGDAETHIKKALGNAGVK